MGLSSSTDIISPTSTNSESVLALYFNAFLEQGRIMAKTPAISRPSVFDLNALNRWVIDRENPFIESALFNYTDFSIFFSPPMTRGILPTSELLIRFINPGVALNSDLDVVHYLTRFSELNAWLQTQTPNDYNYCLRRIFNSFARYQEKQLLGILQNYLAQCPKFLEKIQQTSSEFFSTRRYLTSFLDRAAFVFMLNNNPSVVLEKNKFKKREIQFLTNFLQNSSNLQSLSLTQREPCDISNATATMIAKEVETSTSLTGLYLSGLHFYYLDWRLMVQALQQNHTIAKLELIDSGIDDERLRTLSRVLKTNTTFVSWNLCNNWISDVGLRFLAGALSVNTTLLTLNLGDNLIGEQENSGAESIAQILTTNHTLNCLHFKKNKFGIKTPSIEIIAKALAINTSLKELDLSNNPLRAASIGFLAQALSINTTLKHLGLDHCDIDMAGSMTLAQLISQNSSLTALCLRENCLGPAGISPIAQALKVNTTLCELYLKSNRLGANGVEFLADALCQNRTLRVVELTSNQMNNASMELLAKMLQINRTIVSLFLADNAFNYWGVNFLINALRINTTLIVVALHGNVISKETIQKVESLLEINQHNKIQREFTLVKGLLAVLNKQGDSSQEFFDDCHDDYDDRSLKKFCLR